MELTSEAASSSSSLKETLNKISVSIKDGTGLSNVLSSSTLSPRLTSRGSKLSSPSSTISVVSTQPSMLITPRNFAISSSPNIDFSAKANSLGSLSITIFPCSFVWQRTDFYKIIFIKLEKSLFFFIKQF